MTSLVNSYFNQSKTTEQNLINGLITESIKIMGRTYYYLPRDVQSQDLVLGEDVISKFTLAIQIEMYMEDVNGFQGDKEMYSKFGIEMRNSYTLIVAKDRWETEVKSQFDGASGNGEAAFDVITNLRPQEGDLIYDPLTTYLFEIKFVDHDVEFYQVGKNYKYHLTCEAFQYSNENIATGVSAIDAFEAENTNDKLAFQIKTEVGDRLVFEQDACDYILQEYTLPNDGKSFDTDFTKEALLVEFSVNNPFGDL